MQHHFWPKDIPLSQDMIDKGWEFGRLSIDSHSNRTYENAGYQVGKFIRITNDIEDKYILKTDLIPNGWTYGSFSKGKHREKSFREKLSKALKGRKVSTITKQKLSTIGKCYRWYTNGNVNIRIRYDSIIPNGFYNGRTLK